MKINLLVYEFTTNCCCIGRTATLVAFMSSSTSSIIHIFFSYIIQQLFYICIIHFSLFSEPFIVVFIHRKNEDQISIFCQSEGHIHMLLNLDLSCHLLCKIKHIFFKAHLQNQSLSRERRARPG